MPKPVVEFHELLTHAQMLGYTFDRSQELLREVRCLDEDFDYYTYERDEIQDPESRLSVDTQKILMSFMDEHGLETLEIT